MNEFAEGTPIQDDRLSVLVKEGILQRFPAITNPHYDDQLEYLYPGLTYTNPLYDFSIGIPPHLPYMLALGEHKKNPDFHIYCRPDNRRTGIISSRSGIIFNGISLRYLDEKGVGQLLEKRATSSSIRREYVHVYAPQAGKLHGKPVTWGLTDLQWALHDAQSTESLMNDGLRVVPTIAIVRLKKVPDEDGHYITCKEATSRGLLAENSIPSVQFRAFVTPYRPNEFIFTKRRNLPKKELVRRRIMFLEAIDDMSHDNSIPVDFSQEDESISQYLHWFAETFGKSVGLLHRTGKVHNWLYDLHNVTVDARIIDSDGLELNARQIEIDNERDSLFMLYPQLHTDLWKYYDSIIQLFKLTATRDYFMVTSKQSYDTTFTQG